MDKKIGGFKKPIINENKSKVSSEKKRFVKKGKVQVPRRSSR